MSENYSEQALTRAEVDALKGAAVLDFGTDWCGHCRAARPVITEALDARPGVRHVRIEDGKGRPLGRSYAVKLWPTLIFLKDGVEVARLVRPGNVESIARALAETAA